MYENKITKTFRNRRALLRGSFPSAHEFLVQLETQSAPVVWLHTSSNAAVYWQDGFMAYVKFIDIGEVNTGICLTPSAANLTEGTEDRSFLLFPDAVERLIRQHEGFRHRWALKMSEGGFEFRHPAPSPFFRDLVALIERMGAQYRAARNAEALEAELMRADEDNANRPGVAAKHKRRTRMPSGGTKPVARKETLQGSGAVATGGLGRDEARADSVDLDAGGRASEAAEITGDVAPTAPPSETVRRLIPRTAPSRVRESARPLDPRDTQRFLTFDHLVDAYFDYAANCDGGALEDYFEQRLEGLESLFLCRLPRPGRGRRAASSDRGQVVELAWRCVRLANSLESPFLAPVHGPRETLIHTLWEQHGSELGTPVEELRLSCRTTFKSSLLALFPGIQDTVVGEIDLVDLGVPTDPPA